MDEKLNRAFRDNVVPLIKALKPHATNALLLENNLIVLQSSLTKTRSYMIADQDYDFNQFLYSYFVIGKISPIAAKFKVKKSEISYISENEQPYLRVRNDEEDSLDTYILQKKPERDSLINNIYQSIPLWPEYGQYILGDEQDGNFLPTYDNLPQDIRDKKLCQLNVEVHRGKYNGFYRVLLSRPFFGETKNTEQIRYRLEDVDEKNGRMILKFKQKEEFGDIYHWAAFMMIPVEEK